MSARSGDLAVADPFDDRMVLQRGIPVPIWGAAAPGADVVVQFADQRASTRAESDGSWWVILDPMPANAEDRPLTVTSDADEITVADVVVGDVWLTSGQSNMERSFYFDPALAAQAHETDDPLLRLRIMTQRPADVPQRDIEGSPWMRCTAEALRADNGRVRDVEDPNAVAPGFSAVSYAFGRRIRAEVGVPVGLVSASWGGTRIEAWTPPGASPDVPAPATDEPHQQRSALFQGMLAPWVGYGLSGALWYQGETNIMQGDGATYTDRTVALVSAWRDAWAQGAFPFYFVQLAPYTYENSLPEFWQAQLRAVAAVGNSGMAVTQDIGDWDDIHPLTKVPVGERLARLALSRHYGVPTIDDSGPIFAGAKREGSVVRCRFEFAESGLHSSDGEPLAGFELAAGGEFVPAQAETIGNELFVRADGVHHPSQVRFAWVTGQDTNVVNGAGLPMVAFSAAVE
ncbi:MAG TPA: sialate O-acetylesterase [Candidatus Lumbricidophila sp.]|nr:sialate O-acetylesterase [Candidatus Lumbricidophila sp.]